MPSNSSLFSTNRGSHDCVVNQTPMQSSVQQIVLNLPIIHSPPKLRGGEVLYCVDEGLEYIASDEQDDINCLKNDGKKSLGCWHFDKKIKRRRYVSLTGELLEGSAALRQSKIDKDCALHPFRSARSQLRQLMRRVPCGDSMPATFAGISFDQHSLEMWGIPLQTVARYESNGVRKLFQWQIDCLCTENQHALNGGNLVYSAPTSGGKTLVAEILMLRRLGLIGGTIFFVVPFVALVEEKTEYFRQVWADMHIGVRSFHGDDGGNELSSDIDVAVCTIERANIL